MYERKTDAPSLVPSDYMFLYDAPCIPDEDNSDLSRVYYGTGISPSDHPLKKHIPMRKCAHCGSANVLVIYTQWSVSPHSGDSYWDYEIVCQNCQKFTARSFAEND
jgi:hypothetical protein